MKGNRKIINHMMIIVCFIMSIGFLCPMRTEAASATTMKKAYETYLKKKVSSKKYFRIVNIGKGNKPVLLIGKNKAYGRAGYYESCNVYYYVKGKVKRMSCSMPGIRALSLVKKGGQYYLANGLSDAAFRLYIKDNQSYEYQYYKDGWEKSVLRVNGKVQKSYGYLSEGQYTKYRNSYTNENAGFKFVKNSSVNRAKYCRNRIEKYICITDISNGKLKYYNIQIEREEPYIIGSKKSMKLAPNIKYYCYNEKNYSPDIAPPKVSRATFIKALKSSKKWNGDGFYVYVIIENNKCIRVMEPYWP